MNDSTHCSTNSAQAAGACVAGGMCGWGGGVHSWGHAWLEGGRAWLEPRTPPPVNRQTCVKTLPSTTSFADGRYIFTEETCSIIENQQVTLEVQVSAPCKTDVNVDPGPADVF